MLKKKDLLIFVLKLTFSFSIIAYLFIYEISIKDIFIICKGANFFWIILSFSAPSLGIIISAYRWQILIHAQGDRVPLGFLVKSYLVGNFFNLFLPTRFGGDIVRIWDGSRFSQSVLKSSAIVLVERISGIIVLLFMAFAASLYRLDMAQQIPIIWISLAVGFFGLLIIISFFMPFTGKLLDKIPAKGPLQKFKRKISEFREIVFVYKKKRVAFFRSLFLGFLLQIIVILHYFFIGKALHLKIPFLDYFIFIPIVLIILTIPVTIGGLGLRELLYKEIFKFYLISAPVAVSFSTIADIAFALVIGAIGGIIYVLRK